MPIPTWPFLALNGHCFTFTRLSAWRSSRYPSSKLTGYRRLWALDLGGQPTRRCSLVWSYALELGSEFRNQPVYLFSFFYLITYFTFYTYTSLLNTHFTCLPLDMFTYFPVNFSTCLHIYLHTYSWVYQFTPLPDYLVTCLHVYLLTCLPVTFFPSLLLPILLTVADWVSFLLAQNSH